MIKGIGCDVIEIDRVSKAIARASFVERVFTPDEVAYCQSRGKQAAASFAARFAAKEAVLKALGTGLRGGELKEIEVWSDELGKPNIRLHGYHLEIAHKQGVEHIHLSLTHGRDVAMAYVIMEADK